MFGSTFRQRLTGFRVADVIVELNHSAIGLCDRRGNRDLLVVERWMDVAAMRVDHR